MSSVDVGHAAYHDEDDVHAQIPQKRHNSSELSDDSANAKGKRPGRKPITTEATTKRTAQNRAAQRAFRERRQNYLKGLEDKIQELTERQERTERENKKLKGFVDQLKQENVSLKSGGFTYKESPAEFDNSINELFESQNSIPAGLDLSSSFDLQQAAVQGADLTKPGAMDAITQQIQQQQQQQQRQVSGDSPQSVPIMYPNLNLSSATAGSLMTSLVQQTSGATPAIVGQDALLSTTSSSLTNGFSNDILNGIQLMASNQNLSSGSLLNNLFDSPVSTSSIVPPSPAPFTADSRKSSLLSNTSFSNGVSRSQSLQNAFTAGTTPGGDMFVPLNNIGGQNNGNMMASNFFDIDAFKTQSGNNSGFADIAAMLQQQQQQPVSAGSTGPSRTPTLSELLTLSPSQYSDGMVNFIPSSTVAAAATHTTNVINPALMQQSALQQQQQQFVANSSKPLSPVLPPSLMAYRNPDPILTADDGDQLEKLLLNSMYTLNSSGVDTSSLDSIMAGITSSASPMSTAIPSNILTSAPMASASSSNSNASSDATAVHVTAASGSSSSSKKCTCRECDANPCEPCPVHGSPEQISEELRGMAPQVLEYVCSDTNVMADDELNDLCQLMYKHAKCSEVQKRVEMVREKLKVESDQELFKAKRDLVQQLGLK
ncbi:hypothetical protein LPJ53_000018 [Coemansia erecta]|uniref:BZIP domain-containing protein n=1 Tax=Coemansia erecta TaxID=147472 RepID=A0A9W8CWC0_9FUNG|nr:hypothetical protein LPJ53_000018 [Coemansia erecta]